jgi:hypothetical protein
MATRYDNGRGVDSDARRTLQALLYGVQVTDAKSVKRFANRCMEEGKYGVAGSIYETLGCNRRAADAYLREGQIDELWRLMIDERKLILVRGRAKEAFEIAARQGDWKAAEDWARVAVQGRSNIRSTEVTVEVERRVAEARARLGEGRS